MEPSAFSNRSNSIYEWDEVVLGNVVSDLFLRDFLASLSNPFLRRLCLSYKKFIQSANDAIVILLWLSLLGLFFG